MSTHPQQDPRGYIRRPGAKPSCDTVDVHSLLVREMQMQVAADSVLSGSGTSINSGPSAITTATVASTSTTPPGMTDTFITFDSVNKLGTSNTANGELQFNLATFNNNTPIDRMVQIKVGSFYFPQLSVAAGAHPSFFFFGRAYMQIETIQQPQADPPSSSASFHFEFDISNINGTALYFTPIKDTFYLYTPITGFSAFNVRFTAPPYFKACPLPADTFSVRVQGVAPAIFTITTPGVTTAAIGPVGAVSVAVWITSYSSGTAADASVNSTDGWLVDTVINSTQFSIATMSSTATSLPATCLVGKNRIEIPMRFTSLSSTSTNYLEAIHS